MATPLLSAWRIAGERLPARLMPDAPGEGGFHLPGVEDLSAFAGLLGEDAPRPQAGPQPQDAPFPLPALIPEDAPGEIRLTREIDFALLRGDRALLCFDLLAGSGEALLETLAPSARTSRPAGERGGAVRLAAFDGGPLTLDLTEALQCRRRCRITLRFTAGRPAGVCGPVLLHIASGAALGDVVLRPMTAPRTMALTADICALRAGRYALRAQLCPAHAPAGEADAPAAREVFFSLEQGETRRVHLTMSAPGTAFFPGRPYDAPSMKLWLFALPACPPSPEAPARTSPACGRPGTLCDSRTLLCGYPGAPAGGALPLTAGEMCTPPDALLSRLQALHIPAVRLPAPAPDIFYRALTRAGIGVCQLGADDPAVRERLERYPCVAFAPPFSREEREDGAPVLSAWRLCGMVAYPRAAEPGLTPADLLAEAAGRPVAPEAPGTAEVLAWLRAVAVRLRAEAVRQGRFSGVFCAPGEWTQADIAQALQTALAPLHLSALPLCGAWWTHMRFSASVHAFLPPQGIPGDAPLRAEALLEDARGQLLARLDAACPPGGGPLGLLEGALPGESCVLELTTRLYAGERLLEQSTLPVYVGSRGPLEAAFFPPEEALPC